MGGSASEAEGLVRVRRSDHRAMYRTLRLCLHASRPLLFQFLNRRQRGLEAREEAVAAAEQRLQERETSLLLR
jgi:hypothetical protein